MGLGATYREHGGIGPLKSESTWRVTAFDAPRHGAQEGDDGKGAQEGDDGKMRIRVSIDLEPIGNGTRLTQRLDLNPALVGHAPPVVTWPLFMRSKVNAAMEETLDNCRRLVTESA